MTNPYESAVTADKAWVQGSVRPWSWDVVDLDGTVVDCTGYTCQLVIEQDGAPPGAADVLTKDNSTFTIEDTPGLAAGNNGRITMDGWEITDTTALDHTKVYRYTLWRTNAGDEDIIAFGQAILHRLARLDA